MDASAPADDANAGASSWWSGGWNMISSVAEKVVEAYKEDLGEFVGAVTADTGKAVEDVKQSEWVASAKALATNNTLVRDLVDVVVASTELQRDIGTYCTNPADHQEASYQEFSRTFDSAAREQQIAMLLAGSALLQVNHAKLVPVVVSYDDFWKRYIFRELRLREREEEREQLIRKATVSAAAGEEDMPWEDEDDSDATAAANSSVMVAAPTTPPATPAKAVDAAVAAIEASPQGSPFSPIAAASHEPLNALDGWDDADVGPLESNDTFTKDAATPKQAAPTPTLVASVTSTSMLSVTVPEGDWAVDEWE